jgi:hypothetical protein
MGRVLLCVREAALKLVVSIARSGEAAQSLQSPLSLLVFVRHETPVLKSTLEVSSMAEDD